MAKKMLIDATHLEETRVVVADGNKVDEFDFESINKRQLAGNIYLAKVARVEPSLQAAFVEYGGNRHGFLAFSEVHPDYYQIPVADREALLAEEAAEQKRSAARDEDNGGDGENSKPRSRRGKRRTRSKQPSENTEVKGLEVIELSGEDSASEPGQDSVTDDSAAPAETSTREVKGLEIADLGGDEEESDPARIETAAAGAPDAEADSGANSDDTSTDETDEPATTPKSIAESAGLDDDDSVSEDVLESAPKDAEVGVDEEVKPKAKPTRKRAPRPRKKPAAKAADSDPSGGEDAAAAPADAPAETLPPEVAPEVAPEAGEGTDQPAAGEAKKPTRTRKHRARVKDDDDVENGDTPGGATETVESIGPDDTQEENARARAKRSRHYKIQDVVKARQIMLVQVVKEERGNKGAALTTYLSLAGRYCVLMPNTARGGGISRKITSAGDRKRLRDITNELDVPNGIGLIVRTAGAERTKPEIKRDFEFLLRQWEQIRDLTLKSIAPSLIYEEGSLIKRSIRDLYSKEIDTILVEGEEAYREAKGYMKMLMPSHAKHVQQYVEPIPLFIRYQVESYLNGMFSPVVQLRSGGYIVIGITEALVAIDVNSGRSTKESSIEETALKTNLEAADEVARQLRLRDLAGLIVIDFIDMEENRNNRAVERRIKDRLKSDRARIQVGRISAFGLMEMSRQRLRPGMLEATTQPCPHCQGQGIVRSNENLSLSILREAEEEGVRGRSAEVMVTTPIEISNYIMNMKRAHLARIENRYELVVTVIGDPSMTSPEYRIDRLRTRSRQIDTPDVVITAESVAASSSMEAVEAVPASAPPEERSDDIGEGRSRRRRGKRGGQRRRREESESGAEENTGQTGENAGEAAAATDGDGRPDGGPDGERRSRRRRGGRGRSRRQDDAVVVEAGQQADEDGVAKQDVGVVGETGTSDQPEPVKTIVEDTPAEVAVEAVGGEKVAEPEVPATDPEPAQEPVAELEPEQESAKEPAPIVEHEPEPEPVAAAPAEPENPAAPRRRGWWLRG